MTGFGAAHAGHGGHARPRVAGDGAAGTGAVDPLAVMRTRSYVVLLLVAAAIGAPIAFAAYWFLKLTELLQRWAFVDLPKAVGFASEPTWWPVLPLAAAGLIVGLTIAYLPGHGGESPADGFHAGGVTQPSALPGIALAAFASIGLGAVIGPEMPLVALGGGLAYLAVRLLRRDVPQQTAAMVSAAGSFAAISTLFGTPLAGAFLLMEASSVGGAMATVVLLPGLLGAGIGALIFTGLDSLTGYGTFSLAIPDVPAAGTPDLREFGWAIVLGFAAAPLCVGLRWLARDVRDRIGRHIVPATVLLGLVIAAMAIGYALITGHSSSDVLFSGQARLPGLISQSAAYSAGALAVLVGFKALGYAAAMSAFRGGPVFPALFIGVAGGMALSHATGLPLTPAIAIGMTAMTAGMLRLPMTAVLVSALILGSGGFPVIPLTIVAAVVSYLTVNALSARPTTQQPPTVETRPRTVSAADVPPRPRTARHSTKARPR